MKYYDFLLCVLISFVASTWEIKDLDASDSTTESPRCLVTHMLEIQSDSWGTWKKSRSSKFEKSIPYALLCQVSGELLPANFQVLSCFNTNLVVQIILVQRPFQSSSEL